MDNYNKPYLEHYNGRATRHECPQCHDKHSFSRYLDGDTGAVIHPSVGRCDHENSCGYHYTPKQFAADNPQHKSDFIPPAVSRPPQRPEPPKEVGYIPQEYLNRSLSDKSDFVRFLSSIFDSDTITRLRNDYFIGATKDKGVIFWQIDGSKRIRTGKIMQYNPETGKRIKNASGAIEWVHSRLKKDDTLPDDFNLVQCLFGEHLLKRYPDKVVALVESEKSALIGAGVWPQYVWLATGGRSQLSTDKLRVLRGRTVVMFPDTDPDGKTYALWREKGRELEAKGCKVSVSEILEKNATQTDKEAGIDITDLLIRQLRASTPKPDPPPDTMPPLTDEEKALKHLADLNPNIFTLIDTLDLVSASKGEKINYLGQNPLINRINV